MQLTAHRASRKILGGHRKRFSQHQLHQRLRLGKSSRDIFRATEQSLKSHGVRRLVQQVIRRRPILLQIGEREKTGAASFEMLERREARPVRDLAPAQDRIQVNERKAIVGAFVSQREAKAGRKRSVAHATIEGIFQVQKAVADALGEPPLPMAAAL